MSLVAWTTVPTLGGRPDEVALASRCTAVSSPALLARTCVLIVGGVHAREAEPVFFVSKGYLNIKKRINVLGQERGSERHVIDVHIPRYIFIPVFYMGTFFLYVSNELVRTCTSYLGLVFWWCSPGYFLLTDGYTFFHSRAEYRC